MAAITDTAWRIDPERSSVEFHVRHFYGLITVKGRFERYEGSLDLRRDPAVELLIDADSLESGNSSRDKHLRSDDFFDVADHPQVRFISTRAEVDGGSLQVSGTLAAAGREVPLDVEASIAATEAQELQLDACAEIDHRELGMTWSPLGILRSPSVLIVAGLLVPED